MKRLLWALLAAALLMAWWSVFARAGDPTPAAQVRCPAGKVWNQHLRCCCRRLPGAPGNGVR